MSSQRAFQEPKRAVCAVTNCRATVEKGKVMCLTHWLLVPRELQVEIGHTYRARQMGNYQDAFRRAIDHVEGATGIFTGVLEKRAVRDPARQEGGGYSPVTPPSKPIGMRVRRPRLTAKRLAAIELAVMACLQQQGDGVAKSFGDIDGALLWVRGERAKRRARKAVRV